jgi:hypothetical protein
VDFERAERPQVGLDTGSAAGVGTGDRQSGNGLHCFNLTDESTSVSTLDLVTQDFCVGSLRSTSRLVMGTGGFRSMDILDASLVVSEASIATVALRRVDPNVEGSIYDLLARRNFSLLPNTAGCYSAVEAVKVAELAREAFDTVAVKLEVIGDDLTLLPDTSETLIAAAQLVRDGFEVWAYTSDDLIVAQRLRAARLRGGHAAWFAHRIGSWYSQPARDFTHHRARERARLARRGRWNGLGRGVSNGVGLRWGVGCVGDQ